MSTYYCPRCGAMLEEDFVRRAGEEFDCPECDETVRLDAVAPDLAHRDEEAPAADVESFQEESPPGSRIDCRVAGGQLVIYIPPGSSKAVRGIGCFAVLWLGFMCVFTGIMVASGGVAEAGMPGGLFLLAFLGLFWLIGLGMLYFWVRGRFGKTYVLVEPDRFVLKRELFGREKYKEHLLDEHSRASLAESYRQNEQPVYKVSISTAGGSAGFGTFLSPAEKGWLVARINRHLGT